LKAGRGDTFPRDKQISDVAQERVVRLLSLDVAATLGSGHDDAIRQTAFAGRAFVNTVDEYEQRLVDEVQQYFHETLVATNWPRYPQHTNHPLGLGGGWWRFQRAHGPIAKIGELGQSERSAG
jgi:hypothetical protein